MCGRFDSSISLEELTQDLNIKMEIQQTELFRENVAPSQNILTLIKSENELKPEVMKWGIKFNDDSPLIFNSRIETVNSKYFWRNLFDKNRCLIPMAGFYEWVKEDNKKTPYRISLKDEKYFFVPALYFDKNNQTSTSLITTKPNNFIKDIHHRMPVIITLNDVDVFFKNNITENIELAKPLSDSIKLNIEPADI